MENWRCISCDCICDPAEEDPERGIAPGISFDDLPEDWGYSICGVGKDEFESVD